MIRPSPAGALAACVVLAWHLAIPCPVLSQPLDCERPGTQAQATECAVLRLRAAEREAALLVSELMKSEEQEFKEALAAAQDAWMKWREAEGKLAEATVNDKTLAQQARLTVEAQLTEDRVKDLRNLR